MPFIPLIWLGVGGAMGLIGGGAVKETAKTTRYVIVAVGIFFAYKYAKDLKWIK